MNSDKRVQEIVQAVQDTIVALGMGTTIRIQSHKYNEGTCILSLYVMVDTAYITIVYVPVSCSDSVDKLVSDTISSIQDVTEDLIEWH